MKISKADRFSDLTNRYLIGIGLSGIFVVTTSTEARLMIATDISAALRAIEAQEDAIIVRRSWFSNAAVAARVYAVALRISAAPTLPPSGVPAHDLVENIYQAAHELGVEIRDDHEVAAQCSAAIEEIEKSIDTARASGSMKEVNQAYKQHRREMAESALDYEDWLHGYKTKVVEAAAHRVRSVLRTSAQ